MFPAYFMYIFTMKSRYFVKGSHGDTERRVAHWFNSSYLDKYSQESETTNFHQMSNHFEFIHTVFEVRATAQFDQARLEHCNLVYNALLYGFNKTNTNFLQSPYI